jgi:hypothetical protein
LIKKKVKEYGKTPPFAVVSKLPSEPDSFKTAFPSCKMFADGESQPVRCMLSSDVLQEVRSNVPMRNTHKDLKGSGPTEPRAAGFQQLMSAFMAALGQAHSRSSADIPLQIFRSRQSLLTMPAASSAVVPKALAQPNLALEVGGEEEAPEIEVHNVVGTSAKASTKMPATPKLSVDDATDRILDAFKARAASKDSDVPQAASNASRAKGRRVKGCKKGTGPPAESTPPKRSAKPKAKAKVKGDKPKSPESKPSVAVEWSRRQVQARTGKKGPGNNKAFKFDKDSEVTACKRKAALWLRDQGCKL